ncbi:WD40 repeat-containing protein HOS15-like isoform X1 [Primulina tabacum]|uniref:WD40 repeat-containing protein HOS15-like isoform X1 n=1 Tax=Primulina tabacum TaxID=48773 RepID=UPI003F596FB7
MESITSLELNYLVYRYLHESGFTHAAFTFGFESGLNKSSIDGNLIPPGSLVKVVQKGLQFVEMEANVTNAEIDEVDDFTYLRPLDLITKDVDELYKIVENKRDRKQEARERKLDEETVEAATGRVADKEKVKIIPKKARDMKG